MDEHGGYAPRSPDLSGYHGGPSQSSSAPSAPTSQQQQYQPPPPVYPGYQPPQHASSTAYQVPAPQYLPPAAAHYSPMQTSPYFAAPAPEVMADPDYVPEPEPGKGRRKSKKAEPEKPDDEGLPPAPGVAEGIEVKTKFPVARIKRIMQADEDVGKVAQVTPTAVSKALELFMISLVTKSAAQARSKSAKKVTAAHLKQVIQSDDSFDFLSEIVSKIPDAPAPKKESKADDSADDEPKKKRGRAKRKLDDSD